MYKRMTVLHSQNEAQASRLEEMETELAHVHQELDDLQSQCEDKDAQVSFVAGVFSCFYRSNVPGSFRVDIKIQMNAPLLTISRTSSKQSAVQKCLC